MFYFNLDSKKGTLKNSYDVFYVKPDNTLVLGFLYSHKGINKVLVDDEVFETGRMFVVKQNTKSLKDKVCFLCNIVT